MACDFDVGKSPPLCSVGAWLSSAPPVGSALQVALQRNFPGAVPGYVVMRRTRRVLRPFGLKPENTIYGQSICSDEINNEKGRLATLMQDYWGKCFPMGGIGGAPYVGQTGFSAFSSHVPENGHVIVLFGPHIGISETGELGKYKRIGQKKHSGACGAVLAAYSACCAGTASTDDPLDMQQNWLKQQIYKDINRIRAAKEPLAAVTYAAYEAVKEKLLACINYNYGPGKLVLIGGIQINMPAPYADHFLPLTFQVSSRNDAPQEFVSAFRYEGPELHDFFSASRYDSTKGLRAGLPLQQAALASQKVSNQVFGWLDWAPRVGTPCFQTVHEGFPGAVPGQVILQRASMALEGLGLKPGNTIYGQSLCSDEINHEKGGLADIMKDHWGNCFPMGGIGGAPYVGKTGFMAFSNHVPDDGHVLVLFGPHVAVSEAGEIGKYLRAGQSSHSGACGAVLAAYSACCKDGACENEALDMQQTWLCRAVAKNLGKIKASDTPLAALTREAYEAAKEKLLSIVNHDFGSGYLVLIGGIQINLPAPFEDMFQPLFFRASSSAGAEIDLLDELLVQ